MGSYVGPRSSGKIHSCAARLLWALTQTVKPPVVAAALLRHVSSRHPLEPRLQQAGATNHDTSAPPSRHSARSSRCAAAVGTGHKLMMLASNSPPLGEMLPFAKAWGQGASREFSTVPSRDRRRPAGAAPAGGGRNSHHDVAAVCQAILGCSSIAAMQQIGQAALKVLD